MTRRAVITLGALALLALAPSERNAAQAQAGYPAKPVRIVSDSTVGSANDVTARIVAERLSRIWGQQVVILNQPGAGGGISARAAASALPDGYTLYIAAASVFLALRGGPGVAPNLPVELPRDFAAIGFVLQEPLFLAASPKAAINSLAELIARAKAKPNDVSYASTGRGRLTHLAMELLQARADIKLRLVPYAGGPTEAMSDIVGNRVDLVIDGYAGLAGGLASGVIRGIAVASDERLPDFKDLATVAETLPGFLAGGWNVLLAPVGTSEAIIGRANADLRKALDQPDIKDKLMTMGAYLHPMTSTEVTSFAQEQQRVWQPIAELVANQSTEGEK